MSPSMTPRKAKPLRMWMIKHPDGDFSDDVPQKTHFDVVYYFVRSELHRWRSFSRKGYRAVRVTVREDGK